MALSKRLKFLMDNHNMGNKELSEKSGVPLRTINNILSGVTENPTLETIRALSKALNCTLDDFDDEENTRQHGYYLDEETAKLAQEIYENPELRILFDTTRKVKPADLKLIAEMVKRMSGDDD